MFWHYYVGKMQGSTLRILPDCCADRRRELDMLFSSFVWSGFGDRGGAKSRNGGECCSAVMVEQPRQNTEYWANLWQTAGSDWDWKTENVGGISLGQPYWASVNSDVIFSCDARRCRLVILMMLQMIGTQSS